MKADLNRAAALRVADAWANHPDWSREAWQAEVRVGNVQSGYWDWVFAQIENEDFSTPIIRHV